MKTINRPDMYYKPSNENNVQQNEKPTFKNRMINRIKRITLKDVLIFPFWLIFHISMLPFYMIFGIMRLSIMLSEIPVIGVWIMFLPQILLTFIVLYLSKRI